MPEPSKKKVASPREAYQQAVIILLGARRQNANLGAGEFLLRCKTLSDQVRDRWCAVDDTEGLPSPDQVLSWI